MDLFHTCFSLTFKRLLIPYYARMNAPAIDFCWCVTRGTAPFGVSSQISFTSTEKKKKQGGFNTLKNFIFYFSD